jgi:hypothetical protein
VVFKIQVTKFVLLRITLNAFQVTCFYYTKENIYFLGVDEVLSILLLASEMMFYDHV